MLRDTVWMAAWLISSTMSLVLGTHVAIPATPSQTMVTHSAKDGPSSGQELAKDFQVMALVKQITDTKETLRRV